MAAENLQARKERRRFPRWQVDLPVWELEPEFHVLRGTSVSAGGIFCPDAGPRPVGNRVLLEVDVLGSCSPVRVAARVAHTGSGYGGMGIGLEFMVPQEKLGDLLARFISNA